MKIKISSNEVHSIIKRFTNFALEMFKFMKILNFIAKCIRLVVNLKGYVCFSLENAIEVTITYSDEIENIKYMIDRKKKNIYNINKIRNAISYLE